jgi:hypothetical protein
LPRVLKGPDCTFETPITIGRNSASLLPGDVAEETSFAGEASTRDAAKSPRQLAEFNRLRCLLPGRRDRKVY